MLNHIEDITLKSLKKYKIIMMRFILENQMQTSILRFTLNTFQNLNKDQLIFLRTHFKKNLINYPYEKL